MLQVLAGLSDKEQQAFMRFVTSCSRAPLGGFQYLNPPLTLHKVRHLSSISINKQLRKAE